MDGALDQFLAGDSDEVQQAAQLTSSAAPLIPLPLFPFPYTHLSKTMSKKSKDWID